jgi:hypothetical protein
MDTKGHEKFKSKFHLSKVFAGRKVQKMKLDWLQAETPLSDR